MTSMVPCPGKSSAVNTITGQCQRYQEYERSPTHVAGPRARSRDAPSRASPARSRHARGAAAVPVWTMP